MSTTGKTTPRGNGCRPSVTSSIRCRALWLPLLLALSVAAAWVWFRWGTGKPRPLRGNLRVAVCQYDSRPNAFRWNVDHALRYAKEAASHGADVIVLPEYSFCTVADVLRGHAFGEMRRMMRRLGPRLGRFCRRHGCYLFVNIPHESRSRRANPESRRTNRTLVYAPDGRVSAVYDKNTLASLDEFCRIQPGDPSPLLDLEFGRVGLMICKDASYPKNFPHYHGADLIVVQFGHITDWTASTNDAPWLVNDMGTAHGDFPCVARRLGNFFRCPAVFANKTGLEPEGVYAGGSCAVAADGSIVARAGFGGDILYADFKLDGNGRILPGTDPVPHMPPPP